MKNGKLIMDDSMDNGKLKVENENNSQLSAVNSQLKKGDGLSLPKSWEIKKLGEVCEVFNGSTPLRRKKEYWMDGTINWFTIEDIRIQGRIIKYTNQKITEKGFKSSSLKLLPKNSILLCCTASVGEYAITEIELTTNQQFNGLVIKDDNELLPKYLFYFSSTLKDKLLEVSGKTTIDFVSMTKVKNIEIPIPPLPEQKRIVSILDRAFEAIDKAKAIAEQNLKNVKELFQSKLQAIFDNGKLKIENGEWVEKKLGETFKLKSGDGLTAKNMFEGEYPVFGGNGIAGYHNSYNFENEVIIGRVGALCGNVRYIKEKFWLTDNAFKISEGLNDFNKEFIVYMLNHKNLRSYARQAAQPVISNSSLKDVLISFPKSKSEQKQIVQELDNLQTETKKLEAIYQKKIDNFEELKKSILQKAFNGKL